MTNQSKQRKKPRKTSTIKRTQNKKSNNNNNLNDLNFIYPKTNLNNPGIQVQLSDEKLWSEFNKFGTLFEQFKF